MRARSRVSSSTAGRPRCSSRTRSAFRTQIRHVVAERHPSWVVVQCEAMTDVDVSAARMLEQLDRELNATGIHMAFVGDAHPAPRPGSSLRSASRRSIVTASIPRWRPPWRPSGRRDTSGPGSAERHNNETASSGERGWSSARAWSAGLSWPAVQDDRTFASCASNSASVRTPWDSSSARSFSCSMGSGPGAGAGCEAYCCCCACSGARLLSRIAERPCPVSRRRQVEM